MAVIQHYSSERYRITVVKNNWYNLYFYSVYCLVWKCTCQQRESIFLLSELRVLSYTFQDQVHVQKQLKKVKMSLSLMWKSKAVRLVQLSHGTRDPGSFYLVTLLATSLSAIRHLISSHHIYIPPPGMKKENNKFRSPLFSKIVSVWCTPLLLICILVVKLN